MSEEGRRVNRQERQERQEERKEVRLPGGFVLQKLERVTVPGRQPILVATLGVRYTCGRQKRRVKAEPRTN